MVKKGIKIVVAVALFVAAFLGAQAILTGSPDRRDAQRVTGFYDQRAGSLDAVFLGSSATYAFWMAPYAWQEYGITVYPYATADQPLLTTKYLVEEVRKTQPDAMFIVNLATVQMRPDTTNMHALVDNMPASLTKYQLIYHVTNQSGFNFSEKLELYLPFMRYHDRWSELSESDFYRPLDVYKAGNTYGNFLNRATDVSNGLASEAYYQELDEVTRRGLVDFMEYCEEEELTVLFVTVPQSLTAEDQLGLQNAAVDLVTSYGFDVLDMRACTEEIGIDFTTDFYNGNHTNMHGSIKVTSYLSTYLMQHYGLEDKRGDAAYSDWDKASSAYYAAYLEPRLTDTDRTYFTAVSEAA